MLSLSRKIGEEIIIHCPDGSKIIIKTIHTTLHRAVIGVDAPKEYIIHRSNYPTKGKKDNGSSSDSKQGQEDIQEEGW